MMKPGDHVTIYRIPKNCYYWVYPEMDMLLNKSGVVQNTDFLADDGAVWVNIDGPTWCVPKSCLKYRRFNDGKGDS